jgi:HME family heavy-metal exporter
MLTTLIRLSLRSRTLVLLLAAMLCAWGLYAARTLPTDVLPNLNRPSVTIMTEAPGLAPEEVETQVTFPLESALNGAEGVERVRSTSALGLSVVNLDFSWETPVRAARQTVQERLTSAQASLPAGVTPQMGPVSSIMGEVMLIGLQSSPADALNPMALRDLADWTLRPALLATPGVSQATVMGGDVRQFHVKADPDRLRVFDLTFDDLRSALEASNTNSAGGFIVGPAQELVVRNIARARSADDLASTLVAMRTGVDEHAPRAVLVRDVASVSEASPPVRRGAASMNGYPAVIIAVQKQPGADTRELTARIDETFARLAPALPPALIIKPDLFRQADFIQRAVDNVVHALRDGSIFVVIVLVVFLLSVRTTLITLTAIPLSILGTFVVFSILDMSVNTMTLGGIAVAVGELVDDAVVDVENVYRRLRENRALATPRSPLRVVFEASAEVRSAIVVGTGVVLLVFVPLFALSGIEGRLFRPLAIAYIVSILCSLVVAVTVTPALCSLLLTRAATKRAEPRDSLVLRFFKSIARRAYSVTLPRPYTVIALCAAAVGVAALGASRLGVEFLPPFNEGTAVVSLTLGPGTSLEESDRVGRAAENLILEIPEVKSVARRTGRAEQDEHALGVHASEIEVDFWPAPADNAGGGAPPPPEPASHDHAAHDHAAHNHDGHTDPANPHAGHDPRSCPIAAAIFARTPPTALRPFDEVFADIEARLALIPGAAVSIGQPIGHRIDHLLTGVRAQLAVKISGDDLATLRALAEKARAAMERVDGVVDLQVEQPVLVPHVHLRVKRDAAARAGFTPGDLAGLLETVMRGTVVTRLLDGPRSVDVVLRLDERHTRTLDDLADVRLISPSGAVVLLSDVVEIVHARGPNEIQRESLRRRIVVSCNIRGNDLGSGVRDAQAAVTAAISLPAGYTLTFGGQYQAQQEASTLLAILSAVSLGAMFVLLAGQYRSSALAAQILLNVPFAFIGAVGVLWFTGTPFSLASLVGFITLTGIAVRNGVLMISHYLHLAVHEGMPFGPDLVVRGSQERVAPVLMTAFTSTLALIPLALSPGVPGREILHPVALVVLGGLLTSTALDFFVTPAVFLRFGRRACQRHAAAASIGPDSLDPATTG